MTIRLGRIARDHWADVDGYAVAHGLGDLEEMDLDRFNNYIWWWTTRNAQSSEEVEDFRRKLWMPPKGEIGQGPWAPEKEQESFSALKRAFG